MLYKEYGAFAHWIPNPFSALITLKIDTFLRDSFSFFLSIDLLAINWVRLLRISCSKGSWYFFEYLEILLTTAEFSWLALLIESQYSFLRLKDLDNSLIWLSVRVGRV